MTHTITLSRTVNAAPPHVYRAFTNRTMIQSWFCDAALSHVQPGGAVMFAWNNVDYAVVGQFTALETPHHIAFSWQGIGEPAVSQVEIQLTAEGAGTRVDLTHRELAEDGPYPPDMYHANWAEGLDNLAYFVESGNDLRIQSKPMMGIMPGALSPEQLEALGLAPDTGMLVDGVVDGFSAANAGLQKGDIVLTLGGQELGTFQKYLAAIAPFKGGDSAEVTYLRAGERHTLHMELVARPEPQYPATPADLAAAAQADLDEIQAALDALLDGVDETTLAARPAPDEWSANEVLAHMIFTERFVHLAIYAAVLDADPPVFPGNPDVQRVGILAAYATGAELRAEFKRAQAETVAQMASLSADLVEHKAAWATIAGLLQLKPHTLGHVEQIREALAVVQGAAVGA